jgi:tetratricopeptide (TPR) repeat protein
MDRNRPLRGLLASVLLFASIAFQNARAAENRGWGEVDFPTSCRSEAQKHFELGLAMFYTFSFSLATQTFQRAAEADPSCAIAYWGIAASKMGSLYGGRVRPQSLQDGRTAVEKAKSLRATTKRERDYIDAVEAFYKAPSAPDEVERIRAYAAALGKLHDSYPDDPDAAVLYAYAVTAQAMPDDKTYKHQLEGASILEALSSKYPNHPGIAHYLIHAYDYAPLAARGLDAARRFPQIAPAAPHALQFPAHIFVRLGFWQDSIETNIAGGSVDDQFFRFHALDFLVFSYLQTGQDLEAKKVIDQVAAIEKIHVHQLIVAYALAAMPARYAIERHDWREAAQLELPRENFPWARFPQAEAALVFARALGAARTGQLETAERDLARLGELHDQMMERGEKGTFRKYWINKIEVNREMVSSWLEFERGKVEEALARLRSAAHEEDAIEDDPVVPGPIASGSQFLGEMLLLAERPEEALEAFEKASSPSPEDSGHWKAQDARQSRREISAGPNLIIGNLSPKPAMPTADRKSSLPREHSSRALRYLSRDNCAFL